MKSNKDRDLKRRLSGKELIGFTRRLATSDPVIERASSAKVFKPTAARLDPETESGDRR